MSYIADTMLVVLIVLVCVAVAITMIWYIFDLLYAELNEWFEKKRERKEHGS